MFSVQTETVMWGCVYYTLVPTPKVPLRLVSTFLTLKQGCVLYIVADFMWVFVIIIIIIIIYKI